MFFSKKHPQSSFPSPGKAAKKRNKYGFDGVKPIFVALFRCKSRMMLFSIG